jgi:nucleotide-binding universal stress UspA family protein
MPETPRRGRLGRGAAPAAPRRIPNPPRRLLLATVGEPFPPDVMARAIELATPEQAKITILGIAKVYGTSLGLPNPGLQPNRIEWQVLKDGVEEAADALRTRGFEVRVGLSRSRNAPKMIARWAKARNFHAIVVADPERPRWRRFIEGDITHEIGRRCVVPVYAVPIPSPPDRRARPA